MVISGSNQRCQTIHSKFFQRFDGGDVGTRNASIQTSDQRQVPIRTRHEMRYRDVVLAGRTGTP